MFDQFKKITKILTIVADDETCILQIKFFSGEELLCTVGGSDDDVKKWNAGRRVVTFEIAADEQLIGCELDHGTMHGYQDFFLGVTWLKWKIN